MTVMHCYAAAVYIIAAADAQMRQRW